MLELELIAMNGMNKGKRYPLRDEKCAIGRTTENNIVLEDELVSRRHCVLKKINDTYEIEDLESTNKTIVNGNPINNKILVIGDLIQVGETTFLFTSIREGLDGGDESQFRQDGKVITVTELKVIPDERRLLDLSVIGENIGELRRAHRDLATMYKIGMSINSSQDVSELLNMLSEKLLNIFQADRVVIMLFGSGRGRIVNKITKTNEPNMKDAGEISMSMVQEVVTEGMSILSYDALADERFKGKQSIVINKIRSAMCSPLKGREAVLGILYLDTHKSVGKFTQQDLQLLSIIGNQAGIAIENARLATDLEELFTGSLKTLVATIEAKDSVTSGHSIRVTSISQAIGKELGLSKEAIRILRISALLHDIGKVGVPESILGKPAPLSENEFIRIKEHPSRGAEIIENIKNVEEIVTAVKHHHERYDGGGIPDGLKGDNIPLISRIIAVADAYDAMTFDRPYRKGVTSDKAVKEIQRCSGTQFDPKIVEAFVKAHDKGMLKDITQKFSLEEGK